MYVETPLFELSEAVFGILVQSRSIKVVVEPSFSKRDLPENTNSSPAPEFSLTRHNITVVYSDLLITEQLSNIIQT